MTKTFSLPFQRPAMGAALMLIAVLVLSACGNERRVDRVAFDGQFFNTSAKKLEKDRIAFEVVVRQVSQSLTGAREAGRQEGIRYCIGNFGSSNIEWINGPDAEDGQLRISSDRLTLTGRCEAR